MALSCLQPECQANSKTQSSLFREGMQATEQSEKHSLQEGRKENTA